MFRAEAWRPLPLLSPPITSAMWEGRGLQLRARRDEVVSEDSEDDYYVATGPAKAENVATGRTAMVGDVKWQPGPVAEPLPKKIKGSAGWADLQEEEHGAATGPELRSDAAMGSGGAATGPATKKEDDAATGPETSSSEEEEDEDW